MALMDISRFKRDGSGCVKHITENVKKIPIDITGMRFRRKLPKLRGIFFSFLLPLKRSKNCIIRK
jgi:hypothetical protein